MHRNYYRTVTWLSAVGICLLPFIANAFSIDELKSMISDRNEKIINLEKEINVYEQQLKKVGTEKQTLQSAINELDINRKKISTDISLTQNKISSTDLQINKLGIEIQEKEAHIGLNKAAVAETLRQMHETESNSLIEGLLQYNNLSEVWDHVASLNQVQTAMRGVIKELTALKEDLSEKKEETEDRKLELSRLKQELSGKKTVLDQNRKDKDQLLSVTKSKEVEYQRQLAAKKAAYEQFQRELNEFESQLTFAIDPSRIPAVGQGVLGWPLGTLRITQYFGNTAFARSGAYNGSGHNGMDFAASVGTPVLASLSGEVIGTGNTDTVPGCYSYGKWVLIKHNNGLSTLYAHLSVISVSPGDAVVSGDIIGYSGNTGYSTGPHLHYTVYLSEAVRIVRMSDVKKVTNCGAAQIPVAPLEGYLNPLDYLANASQLR